MARTDLPGKIALLVRGCSRVPRRVDRLSAISGTETNAFVSMSRETDVLVSPSLDSLRTLPSKRYAPARAPIRRNQRHRTSNKNPRTGESIKGFAPFPLLDRVPNFFPNPPVFIRSKRAVYTARTVLVSRWIRDQITSRDRAYLSRPDRIFLRPQPRFFPRGKKGNRCARINKSAWTHGA